MILKFLMRILYRFQGVAFLARFLVRMQDERLAILLLSHSTEMEFLLFLKLVAFRLKMKKAQLIQEL